MAHRFEPWESVAVELHSGAPNITVPSDRGVNAERLEVGGPDENGEAGIVVCFRCTTVAPAFQANLPYVRDTGWTEIDHECVQSNGIRKNKLVAVQDVTAFLMDLLIDCEEGRDQNCGLLVRIIVDLT